MSARQRFTFLGIAVVIAVVAAVVLADTSEDDGGESAQTAATATPTPTGTPTEGAEETPTATPTATPTPEPPPLLTSGEVAELEFTEGETIRFRVRSSEPEEIHVHCYDVTRDVPAGRTINVSFKATITGTCEVEFHGSGEQIAAITVRPS